MNLFYKESKAKKKLWQVGGEGLGRVSDFFSKESKS